MTARHETARPRVSCDAANREEAYCRVMAPRRGSAAGRRMLILAICCMSLLIVGLDDDDRQHRAAVHPAGAARPGVRPAVDDRCLHARAGQPADAVRLDRGPGRPAPRPSRPGWRCSRSARCCAAWRPASAGWSRSACSRRSAARCSTRWRCRSSRNTFTEPAERARAIGIWGGVVGISMALGPVAGGAAGRLGRLARDLLGQHPGRAGRHRAHRAVRARVPGAASAAAWTRSARCWSS